MPRLSTPALRTLLQSGRYGIHFDVLIERLDTPSTSVLQSYSNFGGHNWIKEATWTVNVDQGASAGTLKLIRSHGDLSLAPIMQMSALNRDSTNAYSPAIDFRREMEIRVAITTQTGTPNAYNPALSTYDVGDWITMFQGLTDGPIDFNGEEVVVPFLGRSAYMVGTTIFTAEEYGTDLGTPVLEVMQALSDRWLPGYYQIQVMPDEPEFLIRRGFVNPQQLSEAMKAFTSQFGGRFEDRWSNTLLEFAPTIVMPDRDKTVADYAVNADQYISLHQLKIDPTNLRTIIRVPYTNKDTGSLDIVQVPEDPDSDPLVQKYGPIGMQIVEEATSSIDTRAEAEQYAEFARQDLSTLPIPQEIELLFHPLVELDDLIDFAADGVHYDSTQQGAVFHVTQTLTAPGKGRTRLQVSGAPKGAYASWLLKSAQVSGFNSYTDTLRLFNYRKTTTGDELGVTLSWLRDTAVEEVWYRFATYPEGTIDPWNLLATVQPTPLGSLDTTTIPKPTLGNRTYVAVIPARLQGTKLLFGKEWRTEIYPPPPAAPTFDIDYAETATTSTVLWKLTERGRSIASMQTRTQIGREEPTAWGTPTRGPGAASVVKASQNALNPGTYPTETLDTLEYEQDVSRVMEHLSTIEARLQMADGETIALTRDVFDWNNVPDVQYLKIVSAKTVEMLADSRDTLSIRLRRIDVADSDPAYWENWVDGTFKVFAVPVPDGAAWLLEGRAYGAPKSIATASTPSDAETIQVLGTGAVVSVSWEEDFCELNKPLGNDDLQISLNAAGTVTGLTTEVRLSYDFGSGPGTETTITGSLSPALTEPPTSTTVYTYDTGITAVSPTIGPDGLPRGRLVTATVTAEIRNGSEVKATVTLTVPWYY